MKRSIAIVDAKTLTAIGNVNGEEVPKVSSVIVLPNQIKYIVVRCDESARKVYVRKVLAIG